MARSGNDGDKPVLLRAIELVLADPEDIKKETAALLRKFSREFRSRKNEHEIKELVAEKIISNYSYYAAFAGGASALAGVVPGLGTAIATFGGATADAALSMKYQIEMTMALAALYGHDIRLEEQKRICLIVAGLGAINESAKEGGKVVGTKAFTKMTERYLQGATLQAVKEIFKKVGITFTRKGLEKAIPFGIGVIISFSANKGLTWYVGTKAQDFFSTYSPDDPNTEGVA